MEHGHKDVYEMFLQGSKPSLRYIVKEGRFGLVDRSPPSAPILAINLSLLLSSSPASDEELEKLRSALDSWGCFLMTEHGIPPSYLKKILNTTKQFFELPIEHKEKYLRRSHNDSEGYGGDTILSEKQVLDWSNRLSLKLLPEDQRRLELWPDIPNDFREILQEYSLKIKEIIDLLFKIMAKLLKLEEDSFLNQFGERAILGARFNFYPPCPNPNEVLGLKPHSDKSGLTVLLQDDEVEGLQIYKDKQWFKVPVVPHALLVNIGDQIQIMSNGIIKSRVHRVVVNPEKLRVSVSISNEAEHDKEIGPVPELIDDKRPRLYRNVKNYGAINFEYFQKGEIAIETLRV